MLTVEELKALEVGDWVWIVDFEKTAKDPTDYCSSMYVRKTPSWQENIFMCGTLGHGFDFDYSTYGTEWVAYNNKEEAEGKSIALPCKVGDTAYFISTEFGNAKIKETKIEKLVYYGDFWLVFFYDTFNFSRLDIYGKAISIPSDSRLTFLTKIEAEKRLKELQNNS